MRCDKCGKPIGNHLIRINGMTLCEDCAREMGINEAALASSAFRLLDNELTSFLPPIMREQLEFSPTRSQIKCPKCGTSLKEFETSGNLGCIECYNTFNEAIMRLLMRLQANTHYRGRAPGILSEPITASREMKEVDVDEIGSKAESEEAQAPSHEKESPSDENRLLKFANADIGMLTNQDLKEAIRLAVASEEYLLAAKFRDELNGREGE
ncbi:MAG: hypothetical protein K6F83_04820 [Clostridiales bacterium]|nr:hypothetical protein [Clostridiales bacterium]